MLIRFFKLFSAFLPYNILKRTGLLPCNILPSHCATCRRKFACTTCLTTRQVSSRRQSLDIDTQRFDTTLRLPSKQLPSATNDFLGSQLTSDQSEGNIASLRKRLFLLKNTTFLSFTGKSFRTYSRLQQRNFCVSELLARSSHFIQWHIDTHFKHSSTARKDFSVTFCITLEINSDNWIFFMIKINYILLNIKHWKSCKI